MIEVPYDSSTELPAKRNDDEDVKPLAKRHKSDFEGLMN